MRLRTFGALTLVSEADAGLALRVQRRQLALFAVLAAAGPVGVTRDQLLNLFWSDTDPERARHSLDQLLYAARHVVGVDAFIAGPISLVLDAKLLGSDVDAFLRGIERGDLEVAVAAYTGPFLDGVHLADAPEFERWMEGRRQYFASAFIQALTRLAAAARAKGDYSAAATLLRRAAASDPLSSVVAHALMLALAEAGQANAALDAGRVHAAMVRDQLESEPDAAVSELIAKLRAGGSRAPPVPDRAPTDLTSSRIAEPDARPLRVGLSRPRLAPPHRRIEARVAAMLGVAAVASISLWIGISMFQGARRPAAKLSDRTQLTFSDRITVPAVSGDGKSLAYVTTTCGSLGCSYAIDVQRVGERVTERLLEGAKDIEYIGWSPDRRNLLVAGILRATDGMTMRSGIHLVSTRGGASRLLGPNFACFFAGGDSLLIIPEALPDTVFWIFVAGVDGTVHDSIRVAGPGDKLDLLFNIPGTSLFIVDIWRNPQSELRIIDRHGRELDHLMFGQRVDVRAAVDALWIAPWESTNSYLLRVPFDTSSGRLSSALDTIVHTGTFSNYDVTADGSRVVFDEGVADYDVWAVKLRDALRGEFAPASKRVLHFSSPVAGQISPDGDRISIARFLDSPRGREVQISVLPFTGGAESPVTSHGNPLLLGGSPGLGWGGTGRIGWADSVTLSLAEREGSSIILVLVDSRTMARRNGLSVNDPSVTAFTAVPGGGWAWIPANGQSVRVQRLGESVARDYPKPVWYYRLDGVTASPDGRRLAYWGFDLASDAIFRLTVLSLADSEAVPWWTSRSTTAFEPEYANWLADGTILVQLHDTKESQALYRVHGSGRADALGIIPRPILSARVSADMKLAVVVAREHHGDAWMSQVAPP